MLASTGIRQVTPDVPVSTMAAAYVKDNFEHDSFANNDGTHRWYGDWVEQADDNNPNGGYIVLGWSDKGGKRLILTGRGASIHRKAATPANAASVTLKFKYSRSGLEYGEYFAVQASGNGGGTWTELGRIYG